MDPISLAMALSPVVPKIVQWLSGSDKAADAAAKIVSIAKEVTGKDDPVAAVATIKADPAAALQFRQAMATLEADLDKAFLADRQDARARDVKLREAGQRNIRADIMVGVAFLAVIAIGLILALFPTLKGEVVGFLTALGGMFGRNIGTAFDFEFGSSRSSRDKDATIAGITKG
jgi:hypothetical protein